MIAQGKGHGRAAGWLVALIMVVVCVVGCGQGAAVAPSDATVTGRVDVPWGASDAGTDAAAVDAADVSTRFPCPEGWVAYGPGGCGPAVLLCGPDGGAAPGTCEGNDPTTPVTVRDPDGVEGTAFYRLPDGGIGGGWSTPWECPTGWTNAPEGYCLPTLREDCPSGSGPLPDGTCTPTDGSHCPASEYAEVPPEAAGQRVVYVRAGATAMPDGSVGAPYPDLQQAVAAEPAAEWFLVGPGRYAVGIAVRHPMHVIGTCAARVVFGGATGTPVFSQEGAASRLSLRDVSLLGGSHSVIAHDGASASLRRCLLSGAAVNTIDFYADASVELTECLFGDLVPESPGTLVELGSGSTAIVRRSSLLGRARRGVFVEHAGATALVEDVVLRGSDLSTLQARDHAQMTVRRVSIRGETRGAFDVSRDSRVEAEDLSLRDIPSSVESNPGNAITVVSRSTLTGRRISIERSRGGVWLNDDTTSADIDQIFLRAVRGQPNGSSAVALQNFARLSLRRAQIVDVMGAGVLVSLFGVADVRDTLVHRVIPQARDLFGVGMAVNIVGSLDARRVVVEEASVIGVGSIGLPERVVRLIDPERIYMRPVDTLVRLTVTDLIVRNARPVERYPAFGVGAGVAGVFVGRRVSVDQQPGIGFAAADFGFPTDILLDSVGVRQFVPAASIPALRTILGPVLDGPSSATVDGLFVRGTRPWRISYDPLVFDDSLNAFGSYSVYTGARCTLNATDVTVDGAPGANIGLASLGAAALRRGVVTRHVGCAATLNNTTGAASFALDGVALVGNARDTVCADDSLPAFRLPISPN